MPAESELELKLGGGPVSRTLFDRAQKVMPGGVNSPVRAFGAVGGTPVYFRAGRGARLYDEDDRQYIDYVMSWGALILGHAPAEINDAVQAALAAGTHFGANTRAEVELAEELCRAVPSLEMVRLVSSGTEATMSALRLARAATGRAKIVKFAGCYHGHADSLLVKAGSGVLTMGIPGSPGVTAGIASDTLVAPYNDADAVVELFAHHGAEIAAVIVEPVAANMGCVPPAPGFLAVLRELTTAHGALLIFDEVITGFRLGYGGAQALYGITPDLTCLGKIIGGGLPMGAYGGRRDLMAQVAPAGSVYQAGTLSGNPPAVRAGLAALAVLAGQDVDVYAALEANAARLADGMAKHLTKAGLPCHIQRAGSLLTVFFNPGPVHALGQAAASDTDLFRVFFHGLLQRGIYIPPSQFECWFVSAAHGEHEIDATLAAAADVAADMAAAAAAI